MRTLGASERSGRRVGGQVALLCCCLVLGGCETVEEAYDSKLTLEQPVDWWHQLQGGAIAEQRPPPPGAADPYPNLGQVPARPMPTDAATRRALLARLASERDKTKQAAAQEPIVWPVPDSPKPPPPAPAPPVAAAAPSAGPAPAAPAASPAPAAAAPPPVPANSDVSTMVFEGATPAPAAAAPAPAPRNDPNPPAAFAPAARAVAPPQPGAASAGPVVSGPVVSGPVVSGPVPALPASAPAPPRLAGIPAATFAPATPRPLPSTSFAFAAGSAALPAKAEAALRDLAGRRAGAAIQVRAGGDARSPAPDAQEAALPLALRRTGAITAVLIGAGVPAGSVRAEAVGLGRDGSARLVD